MTPGTRVAFRTHGRRAPVLGTVRAIKGTQARVDDGDPNNDDLYTNNFRVSAWVDLTDLTVVS